jgi:aryl-alcohol dehydrogenase-like predicted oxidoreductase
LLTTRIAGIEVGRLGLGCFPFSGAYGRVDESAALATIREAVDLGVNLLDTADAYGAGENEKLVGRAVADRREKAVIATKFGRVLDTAGKAVGRDSSPGHVRRACEASLRRLGTDYIDLYIQHRVDPAVPIEETIGELGRLREEGKIRAIGLCEAGPATITRAHGVAKVAALQTEYSLWSREPERELLPLCQRLGITFVAYSPLGRGFLTGSLRSYDDLDLTDSRRSHPRFLRDNLRRNGAIVDRVRELALGHGCTPAQLALAWLLTQPWGIVPIPATRHKEHLRENIRALQIQISRSDLDAIGEAFPDSLVWGARYSDEHLKTIDR